MVLLCPCSNGTNLLPLLNSLVCKQGGRDNMFEQKAPAQNLRTMQTMCYQSLCSPIASPCAGTWIKAEGLKLFVPISQQFSPLPSLYNADQKLKGSFLRPSVQLGLEGFTPSFIFPSSLFRMTLISCQPPSVAVVTELGQDVLLLQVTEPNII